MQLHIQYHPQQLLFSIEVLYKTRENVDYKYIILELHWNFFQKHVFCGTVKKNVKKKFSLKSEAGIVLNLSLIFGQISAWRPYKLGPYKKKV